MRRKKLTFLRSQSPFRFYVNIVSCHANQKASEIFKDKSVNWFDHFRVIIAYVNVNFLRDGECGGLGCWGMETSIDWLIYLFIDWSVVAVYCAHQGGHLSSDGPQGSSDWQNYKRIVLPFLTIENCRIATVS